ncbi:MAG: hypothetical protein LBC13_02455, partial [Clostridiales bacterium]|nr:hypothetical protein [Clostridiales bacterium]
DVVNAGTYYYEAYYAASANDNYMTNHTSRMAIKIMPITVEAKVETRSYIEGRGNGVKYTLLNGADALVSTYVVYKSRETGEEYAVGVIPAKAGSYDFKILASDTNYTVSNGTGVLVIGKSEVVSEDSSIVITSPNDTMIDSTAEIFTKTIFGGVLNDKDADPADIVKWRAAESAIGRGNKLVAFVEINYTVINSAGVREKQRINGTVQVRLALPDQSGGGTAQVRMALSSGVDASKMQIVKINDDGTYSAVRARIENGYAVFNADELGTYAFITTETPMWVWLAVGGGVLLIVLICVVLMIVFNRRGKMAFEEQLITENSDLLDA